MGRRLKVISLLLIVVIFTVFLLGMEIKSFGRNAKPEIADCIIVLGCSVYGTEPSPFLKGRLGEAERLYREGYADYIIVSGGQGKGEHISEAEAMRVYLEGQGVDSQDIIMEDRSTSTYENIEYSKEIMAKKNFSSAIIVSNQFHLKRASYIARHMEVDASYSGVYMERHLKSERKGFLREIPATIITFFKLFLK